MTIVKSWQPVKYLILLVIFVTFGTFCWIAFADNPLVTTDYYADPSCRVFNGTITSDTGR